MFTRFSVRSSEIETVMLLWLLTFGLTYGFTYLRTYLRIYVLTDFIHLIAGFPVLEGLIGLWTLEMAHIRLKTRLQVYYKNRRYESVSFVCLVSSKITGIKILCNKKCVYVKYLYIELPNSCCPFLFKLFFCVKGKA